MKKFSLLMLMLLMVVGCGYGVNSKLPREMTEAELAKSLVGVWELQFDNGDKRRFEFLYNPTDESGYQLQGDYIRHHFDEKTGNWSKKKMGRWGLNGPTTGDKHKADPTGVYAFKTFVSWDTKNEALRKLHKDTEPSLWSMYDGDSADVSVRLKYYKTVRVEAK